MIGRTLLHYRVRERLGAGGMGEVYRATDAKLGRDVAIKVLPGEVAHDPVRLSRFRREAQLLSALNHPHVAAIYGLEEVDGVPFLALELVEGEDLAQRLKRGAIPVDEALEIALQIAEALEEAHRRGIVHRDLKPSNVKVTPEGQVKVLDFGLAKAWGADGSDPAGAAESPTLTHTGTMAGVILGTAAYMSPEQARGKAVDRRADVWSFGVVLWEMLTGRRLFTGESVTDVLAAVVTKEPDLGALPAATPAAARRLIERCLRKDARTRLPDIGAARLELQDLRAGIAGPSDALGSGAATGRRWPSRSGLLWPALALVATAVAGFLAWRRLTEPTPGPPPAVWFTVDPPEGRPFPPNRYWSPPSPDGRTVLFFAPADARTSSAPTLWARSLGSRAARPLHAVDGVEGTVFWSPDSRRIAFFAQNELRSVNVADGTVQKICTLPDSGVGGGDWNEQGLILFSTGGSQGRVYSVAVDGGQPALALAPDASRGERLCHAPRFLPDGRRFLVWVGGDREEVRGTYIASLDAQAQKRRLTGANVTYSAGHLLYIRDSSLVAQPFDLGRGEPSGEPVPIAESVGASPLPEGGWLGWFASSRDGTLAWYSGQSAQQTVQLAWVDRTGKRTGSIGEPAAYGQVALSPRGDRLAVEKAEEAGRRDIWTIDVARGVPSRVTATPDVDESDPVWSPDGRTLTFAADYGKGEGMLHRKELRAAAEASVLPGSPRWAYPESWTSDGRTLLFVRGPGGTNGVWALHLPGGGLEPVLDGRFQVDEPQVSPDARWLAYVSRESGQDEIYVEPFGHKGDRVRVSPNGGGEPKWREDGRELFYVSPRSDLMAVGVRASGARLDVGEPVAVFPLPSALGPHLDDYAPSANGQKFVVRQPAGGEPLRLNVVTHWPSLPK